MASNESRKSASTPKEFFTTHDIARICSVTPMTVIRWIDDGRLAAFKTAGGHRRVKPADLEVFCRQRGIPYNPVQAGRRRVLVLAGNREEREALAAAARGAAAELEVDVAGDALDGGRIMSSIKPQLLILDDRVTGGDVGEVCARLKGDSTLGGMEILVFGPAAASDAARKLRGRGVYGCLSRPVDPTAVRTMVRGALGIESQAQLRRARVLVVDDDPLFLRALRRELERRGVEVVVADKGYDALLLLGSIKPDLVLLDLTLPDLDGIEVTRRVRARPETAEVAILGISANFDDRTRRKLMQAGALDLLGKPFSADEVVARIPAREPSAQAVS